MKTTFVVGDIHGCLPAFDHLLEEIEFKRRRHRLWLVGDIVNRGPDSLGMLRRAHQLSEKMGDRFRLVLGNHDLHLLGVYANRRQQRAKDTLDEILAAADCSELLSWLRQQPLAHAEDGYLMVHAGLQPPWGASDALTSARKLEARLRKKRGRKFFETRWTSRSLATLTRVRMLDSRYRMAGFSGPPECASPRLTPWYDLWVAHRKKKKVEEPLHVLFGHWAALGQRSGGKGTRRWTSLDTGCVYGRNLTALRLNDHEIFTVSADSN